MEEATQVVPQIDYSVALNAIERAGVDVQVTTAKKYPRDVRVVVKTARAMALLNEEMAASMLYALPRKDEKGNLIHIEGPSTRLAEVLVSCWGNSRVDVDLESVDERTLTAVATFFDTETNVAIRTRVRRNILRSNGRRFSDDMVNVTANAAMSIGYRNVAFRAIPRALWLPIYEDARRLAMGSTESIARRWRVAMEWFGKHAITEDRVLAVLGRESVGDVTPDDFLILSGLHTALKDGELSLEQVFPPMGEEVDLKETRSKTETLLRRLSVAQAQEDDLAYRAGGGDAAPKAEQASQTKAEPASPADLAGAATVAEEALNEYVADVLRYCRETSPAGSAFAQPADDDVAAARTLAATVFPDGERRAEVLAFIDGEKRVSPYQLKVVVAKLKIAAAAPGVPAAKQEAE
jgi:hypothetical protein